MRFPESMPRKDTTEHPAPIQWRFDPATPTHDLFDAGSLDNTWNLQEAVDNFVFWLEKDLFLAWEAAVSREQGLFLTAVQKRALNSLLDFSDEDESRILYIDELPRPREPWHVLLNQIVPHLLIEPYRTFDIPDEVRCEGWSRLIAALREHGRGLSLVPGANVPEEVVPLALRHKLWLQSCFDDLGGLGQDASLTLEDPEEHYRIERFVDHLRECKESVAFFSLTLESMLTRVILPEKDQPIFLRLLRERLGVGSDHEQIIDRL